MSEALISGSSSNTITLIQESQFSAWQEKQSSAIQRWIKKNDYKGNGLFVLPGDGDDIFCAYGISSLDEFYLAGDLPNQLPLANYTLDTSLLETDENIDEELLNLLQYRFATSWGLAAYCFTQYKDAKRAPASLTLSDDNLLAETQNTVSAISLTRDLINTPASDMMPQHLSSEMQSLAQEFDGVFKEIVGHELLEQNYPLIHAVGRASVHPPRLIELRWGDETAPAITLVGKGVCFDSGGLNIKTGGFMRQMKKDMGGAAHVLGLARLIMSQGLAVNLRVLIAAAENAISGNAFRPGDVITSRKGITVEIDNTDAEGRLVLCDALDDACAESPELLINFATLTGACRVALGTELAGFFCNDESVATGIYEGARTSLDPVWRLPLFKPYDHMLKSHVADTTNSAETGYGGAITAALYLEKFIAEDVSWAHFDIMAWNIRNQPGRPVGGEALGVRAVYEYLKQRFS